MPLIAIQLYYCHHAILRAGHQFQHLWKLTSCQETGSSPHLDEQSQQRQFELMVQAAQLQSTSLLFLKTTLLCALFTICWLSRKMCLCRCWLTKLSCQSKGSEKSVRVKLAVTVLILFISCSLHWFSPAQSGVQARQLSHPEEVRLCGANLNSKHLCRSLKLCRKAKIVKVC